MKIKQKLTLGVGLLFLLIILLTALSIWYINALKKDTNNILTANYNTLEYSRNMILALDEMKSNTGALSIFERNLELQQQNETEPGEKEATSLVSMHFAQLKTNPADSLLKPQIRSDISRLMLLNMKAIKQKSGIADNTAESATIWITASGTLCFLIAFVLLINLPGSIADPIRQLTASIKQIADKNYHERVHFESHSELGELATSFNIMAEKLEEYNGSRLAEILMEKKRIDTLINNMHDPVMGLDEKGKVLFANDQALKITGLKKEEMIGKEAALVARSNDLIRDLIGDLEREEPRPAQKPSLKIYADDKESYFEKEVIRISVVPTGEREKMDIGAVILLRNVTPFKELDFAKTNFIATVSHELKTPISSIQMSTQLLKHLKTGKLNEEQLQLVESIDEDSGRLLRITRELLNMTQVESGHIQLNIAPGNTWEVLKYALDATRTQAEQKQIRIVLDADKDIPPVNMDTEKTAWVLTNLVTNAIRYSPENSEIIITLTMKSGEVLYAVKDHGKGIDPQYRQKVFDRYFQIPGSLKSGSGLGLAISKEFIEAQGGHIGVIAGQGVGSTFYFSFPV